MSEPVKILVCTCTSKFQDERHGQYRRVFNKTKGLDGKLYRCSSCLREIASGASDEELKKQKKR